MNNIKIKKKKRLEETESLFICYKGKNQFICFEIKKKKSLNPQKKKKKKKKNEITFALLSNNFHNRQW